MRLDSYLYKNGFYSSRNKASEAIERGEIWVDGKVICKPSFDCAENCSIEIIAEKVPYVSLGGYKLEKAINAFSPAISGNVFIDVGASTGGFTDCLLRNGAKKVYCVDVGHGLLNKKIAEDKRTVVMDDTNAKDLTADNFDEKADGIVVDCSFISLQNILPHLYFLLKDEGYFLALIKPQFETGGGVKMKNGVLRNDKERRAILKRIYDFVASEGLSFKGLVLASCDEKKNKEYVAYITKKGKSLSFDELYGKAEIERI